MALAGPPAARLADKLEQAQALEQVELAQPAVLLRFELRAVEALVEEPVQAVVAQVELEE